MAKRCNPGTDKGCVHPNHQFEQQKRLTDITPPPPPPPVLYEEIPLIAIWGEEFAATGAGIQVGITPVNSNPSLAFIPIRRGIYKRLPYAATNAVTGNMFMWTTGDMFPAFTMSTNPTWGVQNPGNPLQAIPSGFNVLVQIDPPPASPAPAQWQVQLVGVWRNLS